MRTSTLVPAALLVAFADVASAGGYLSVGVGGDAMLGGGIERSFDADARSRRFSLGSRIGPFALEAGYWSAGLVGVDGFAPGASFTTRTLGLDVKGFAPVAGALEVYGKLGVNHAWLDGPEDGVSDFGGRGWELGSGLEYAFVDLPLARAAVFADLTHHRTALRDEASGTSGSMTLASLGLSVGY